MLPTQYLEIYGIKKKDLAEAVGIRPTTLSNYLSGKRKPSLEIIQKFQKITKGKVTLDDWLKLLSKTGK